MFESITLSVLAVLEHMDSMAVSGLFVVMMLALFASALITISRGRAVAFYQSIPTMLTTLGILGTFLGIALGLLEFDATQVEYSIPLLLDGLKLAFITSIVGILLSASLRLILVLGRDSGTRSASGEETRIQPGDSEDPMALFQRQAQLAEAHLTATQQLVAQVMQLDENLIQTLERQHEQQLTALSGFAEQLSEIGSRQLIAALESVIRDFNSNLGAQFGDNFRRLDASVEKLLRWQEQYREHMDALGQQLDHATDGVAKSEASLQALTQQARQISLHVEDQSSTMVGLRRETMEMESVLSSIAELRDRAKEAFPAIDNRLKAMLESIEGAVLSALSAQQRLDQYGMDGGHRGGAHHDLPTRAHA